MDLLISSLLLVSCVSCGICGIIITRNKTTISPIARRRIKEYEEDTKAHLKEITRLKGAVNRAKQGPTIRDVDIQTGQGSTVLDTIIEGLPQNYKKIARKYKHMIEPLVLDEHGSLKPEVIEKISSITTKGPKPAEPTLNDRTL